MDVFVKDWTTFYTPEQRTEALLYFFGWQGGTVHQLAEATGLTVSQILYEPFPGYATYSIDHKPIKALTMECEGGFSAVRTCSKEFRSNYLAYSHKGDFAFWAGVVNGYFATGPLTSES